MIKIKRIYEPASTDDGVRFLVDRLWPRGMRKDSIMIDAWLKNVAPSNALRQWYSHDPEKWDEFQQRYFSELDNQSEAWQPILEAARQGDVTLLFSTRIQDLNNAVALKAYLEKHLAE